MDVWLAITHVLIGAIGAVVFYDLGSRGSVLRTLRDNVKEYKKIMADLHNVHNSLSNKVLELEERLAALDLKINASVKQSRPHINRR